MRVIVPAITDEQAKAAATSWLAWISKHRQNIEPAQHE